MKLAQLRLIGFWAVSFLITSCLPMGDQAYEDLAGNTLPNKVTWQDHIAPLLAEKCGDCHSVRRGKVYEGISYDNIEDALPADGGGGEEDEEGFGGIVETAIRDKSMPPGTKPRLSPREIALLHAWQEDGFPEE